MKSTICYWKLTKNIPDVCKNCTGEPPKEECAINGKGQQINNNFEVVSCNCYIQILKCNLNTGKINEESSINPDFKEANQETECQRNEKIREACREKEKSLY